MRPAGPAGACWAAGRTRTAAARQQDHRQTAQTAPARRGVTFDAARPGFRPPRGRRNPPLPVPPARPRGSTPAAPRARGPRAVPCFDVRVRPSPPRSMVLPISSWGAARPVRAPSESQCTCALGTHTRAQSAVLVLHGASTRGPAARPWPAPGSATPSVWRCRTAQTRQLGQRRASPRSAQRRGSRSRSMGPL